jgi:L-amino acid N-acyltransferase YncA
MSNTLTTKRNYPWTTTLGDKQVTFRLLQRSDLEDALRFAKAVPQEDITFLTFDITDRAGMEEWLRQIENNRAVTVLAEVDRRFVGYVSLTYNQVQWTRHMGEIRLLVGRDMRGRGLGKLLINEIFLLAQELGLQKLIARMAAEQEGARALFEQLGFHAEALLADHVIDREGHTHDLVMMSYDVNGFTEQ